MIISKKLKLKIIFILLIIGIDLCIGATPLFLVENSHLLRKKQELELYKTNVSNQGFINYSKQRLFWFIHISDTQFVWSTNESINRFYQLLNETYKEIKPLFIYNTGDLVDANHGAGQDIEEWKLYQTALKDNKMNSSIYKDLIGNHDAVNDPDFSYFLNFSMTGRKFRALQYSFNKSFSFGKYAFIGLNTAKKSYNLYEFAFIGSLNTSELDWYENELEKYKDFDRIFVFGHHPHYNPAPYLIISNLSTSGKSFFDLNKAYNIDYYLSGHAHVHSYRKDEKLLMITTSNFDYQGGTYRIITIDHNYLSTTIGRIGIWPQAVITYPSNEHPLIEGLNRLRVLAWDPNGVNSVEWSLYSDKKDFQITNWIPLEKLDGDSPLWEGDFDFQFNGRYILKVKIDGVSGQIIKELNLTSKSGWTFEFSANLIFMIISLVSIAIIILNYSRHHIEKLKQPNK